MAASVTLLQLRTRIRFEADMVNSARATDAQITTLVNTHWAELYDRLVASGPPDYYSTTSTLANTTSGTIGYTLPTNFRSLLCVYSYETTTSTRAREVPLLPEGALASFDAPQGAYAYAIRYVPTATQLSADADTLDGVSGWDELIVQLCARALRRREGRDVSAFDAVVAECRARVMANAPKRNSGGPRYINDVEAADLWPGYGSQAGIDAYRIEGNTLNLYQVSASWP